jgi:hypothetical protein
MTVEQWLKTVLLIICKDGARDGNRQYREDNKTALHNNPHMKQ